MIDRNADRKVIHTFEPTGSHVGEVLEACGTGRFQHLLLVVVGLTMMSDAMEVTLLGFLAPCVALEWNLSSFDQGVLTASVFAGQLVGALYFGLLSDIIGRRKAFWWSSCTIVSSGYLTSMAPNYGWLLFFRMMAGFGVGGMEVPFDLAAEFFEAKRRGRRMLTVQSMWGVGSMYLTAASWLLMGKLGYSWRALALAAACPPTLVLLAVGFVPESPRWLLVNGRVTEAQEVLRKVAETNGVKLPAFKLLRHETSTGNGHVRVIAQHLGELVRSKVRRTTFTLWALWAGFGFSYYGAILLISKIFLNTGASSSACSFSYGILLASAAAELTGIALAYTYVDYIARRRAISGHFLAAGVSVLLLPVLSSTSAKWPLAMIGRGAANVAASFVWIVTPELFSTEIRGTGHATCNAIARLGAGYVSFWIEWTTASSGLIGLSLAAVSLSCSMAAWRIPVDTTGVELDTTESHEGLPLLGPDI